MSIFRAIKYTRHKRCWRIAILVLFLLNFSLHGSIAQMDTAAASPKQHLITMSYLPNSVGTLILGQPLVQVTLNGTTIATFVVDTGTSTSVISQSLAKKLKLRLVPAVADDGKPFFFIEGREQSSMALLSGVNIGGLIFNNQEMVVAEEKAFVLHPGSSYDGIIGMNMLRYVALLLDTRHHTFTFSYPGAVESAALTKLKFTAPYVLPLADDKGVRWVQAQFSDHGVNAEERLMLDIGSNKTCVSSQMAKQLGLKAVDQQQEINLFGNETVDTERVGEFHLGPLTLNDLPLTVFNRKMRTKTLATPSVLGLDILSGYLVLMDFPGGKLYLQPYPSAVPTVTVGPAPATAPLPAK